MRRRKGKNTAHLAHKRTYTHRSNNPTNSSHSSENVHIDKIHNEYCCLSYYEWQVLIGKGNSGNEQAEQKKKPAAASPPEKI